MEAWQIEPYQIEGYDGLEQRAEKFSDAVRQHIDRLIGNDEPLIDESFELAHPTTYAFTNHLTAGLGLGTDEKFRRNSYAGFQFGVLLSRHLVPEKQVELSLRDFYNIPAEDIESKLNNVPDLYLQHRTKLDTLISRYVSDISDRLACWQLVSNTATLACVHVEQYLFDQFVDDQVAKFAGCLEAEL